MPTGDLYTRQERLQLTVPSEVTIVGLGGIGSWVAIDCAMSGVESLYLFDPDVLEESNRNRLPFCQSSINRPKVEVVSDYIRAIRPDTTVVAIQDRLAGLLLDIQLGISRHFIDCTDSPKTQMELYKRCKTSGVRYIRAGYDGTRIMVTGVVSGWIKASEEEHYQVNPSWVVPAQIVAALAVGRLMKYENQEVSLDISEIGIPILQRQARRTTARCRQVR
jgi:molybdopterin/thiamine biosynthesis adenylyltransferase